MASNQKFDKPLNLVTYQASATSFFFYIADSAKNKAKLFQEVKSCRIDEHKCRFNLWRILLGVCSLTSSLEEKAEQLKTQRDTYKNKKQQAYSIVVSPQKKQAPISKNPLMKAMVKTPKVQQVDDQFLKEEIKKDVQRTYQQLQFFQQQSILKLLTTVLFVWCKRNPDVSYKQGMNQVLASLVYVYFQETFAPGRHPEGFQNLAEQKKITYTLFNSLQFAEPDIYCVFEKIMNIQNQMYKTQTDSNLKGVINPNSKNNTPILQRIINIIDQKLKALDIQLFRVIKLQDVQTKTFLLRWIRCMHTREFSLENSFIIWDSIFLDYYEWPSSKEKCQFEFIDAMCVAMFVYMRSIALTRESAYQIQQTYQKYPNLKKGGYLEQLLSLAWSLCETLRQPASLNSSDWVGQNNSKADHKIQLLKSKDQVGKSKEDETPKPKQPVAKPKEEKKQPVKEVKKVETKVQAPKPVVQQKTVTEVKTPTQSFSIQGSQQKHQKHSRGDFNFPIVLASEEWHSLVEKLQKCLSLTTDEQAKKQVLEAIQIIKSKVENM